MKKTFLLFLLVLTTQITKGQIDGSLLMGLTQATTTEMNAITNPVLGSLVYNTTDFSLYQYIGSSWIRIFDSGNNGTAGTKVNFGGRWTNNDITTDLNVDDVVAPVFGVEDYKDDGNALYEISGNTLIVKEAGRYDLRVNLAFINVDNTRNNPSARLDINGTLVGARAASGYIRNNSNHTQSSIHINEIMELNANDVISVIMFREGNDGSVLFSAIGESSFIINKLK